MRELRAELAVLALALAKDAADGSRAAFRLIAPIVATVVKQRLTWYGIVMSAIVWLTLAPSVQRWDDKATGRSLIALAMLYPVAELLARGLDRDVTAIAIRNHLGWLAEVDETVHEFNIIRAINANEIRQIQGEHTLAELQIKLSESQEKMAIAMMGMQALQAGEEATEPVEESKHPVRDLAGEMGQYEGHFLIASRTRSGKTTLIQQAIANTLNFYGGLADIYVFDPKGAAWNGIEKDSSHYIFCNNKDSIPAVIERLAMLEGVLENRQRDRVKKGGHYAPGQRPMPMFIILDEFNTLKRLAQSYDAQFPVRENPKTAEKLRAVIERVIFQGGEDLVFLWLMAQTTRVAQLDLDTSVQDNMAYVALSRRGDYQSVEDAIGNQYVISSQKERKRLQDELADYRSDKQQDLEVPIAFTTLGGNQLCKLPDARRVGASVLPAASQQMIDEAIEEEFADPRGKLEKLLQLPEPEGIHPSEMNADDLNQLIDSNRKKNALSVPAKTILDKYIQKEMYGTWIDAKWVRNFAFRSQELSRFSAAQIREFLIELAQAGSGVADGEDDSIRWYMEQDEQ